MVTRTQMTYGLLLGMLVPGVLHTRAEDVSVQTIVQANRTNNQMPTWMVIRYDCNQFELARPNPDPKTSFERSVRFHDELRKANPWIPTRRELCWNTVENKWKLVATDQRDLRPLLASHGLNEEQGYYLNGSYSLLRGPGLYMAQLSPGHRGPVLMIDRLSQPKIVRPPIWIGTVGDSLFESAGSTELSTNSDGKIKMIVHGGNGNLSTATLLLDPAKSFHVLRWQQHINGRLVREQVASDYRSVDRIIFPFRQEERRWNPDGELVEESMISVQDVSTEAPSGPLGFEVPPNTTVMNNEHGVSYQTDRFRTLTLDSLPRFVPLRP